MRINFHFFFAVLCGFCVEAAMGGARSSSEPPAPRQSFALTLATNGDVALGSTVPAFGLRIYREGWSGTFVGEPSNCSQTSANDNCPQIENAAYFRMKDGTGAECVKGRVALDIGVTNVQFGICEQLSPLPIVNNETTATLSLRATVLADVRCECVAMEFLLPAKDVAGSEWRIGDAAHGIFPEQHGETRLFYDEAESLSFIDPATRKPVELRFPQPVKILLQDSRLWGPNFNFRIEVPIADSPQTQNGTPVNPVNPVEKNATLSASPREKTLSAGSEIAFDCTISHPDGIKIKRDHLVVIEPSEDWIPLDLRKNIVAGSALDFSHFAQDDAPAGKYGYLKVVGDHFEFEGLPGVPQRFYGVNLCNDANYPDAALADELVVRLKRLGYNAIRIHHHDGMWIEAFSAAKNAKERKEESSAQIVNDNTTSANSASFAAKTNSVEENSALSASPREDTSPISRLDYFLSKCFEAGIYVTTDLYVSRRVAWRDIGFDRDGDVPGNVFKNLIALHEPAFENWRNFTQAFLEHVNPYTGHRYADEPGLVTICLVNEGTMGWAWNIVKKLEPVKEKWREWKKCPQITNTTNVPKSSLSTNINQNPANPVNPVEKNTTLPDDPAEIDNYLDSAAAQCFAADMERASFKRQKVFLKSIGCKALLSSQNCADSQAMASARDAYDYVDNHFYHGNPKFLGKMWSAPFRFPNGNPIKADNLSLVNAAYTRLAGKPYTITEWNFSGPNRHRAVGALLVGAMAARQEWDGLWRFAYSHVAKAMREGAGAPHLFDVTSDALNQASERAVMALFLRGDMAPLENKVALNVGPARLTPDGKPPVNRPEWMDEAWNVQVGRTVSNDTIDHKSSLFTNINQNPVNPENPVEENFPVEENSAPPREASWAIFPLESVISTPPVAPAPRGDFAFDRENGTVAIDTPRTCGVFAESGTLSAGPLAVAILAAKNAKSAKEDLDFQFVDNCEQLEFVDNPEPSSLVTHHSSLRCGGPTAATVFAISLDGLPLADSSRILVTHLTDAQKQGNIYADEAKSVLLRWGGETTLVRNGKAEISLALRAPESYEVWGLATDGTRMERIEANAEGGSLVFTADVNSGRGARMFYELSRKTTNDETIPE